VKRLIVTMLGVGYLPASGTFASLLTCLILLPILNNLAATQFGHDAVALGGTIFFSILNVALGPWAIQEFGDKDPSRFVLDEAAGICLTILCLPAATGAVLIRQLGLAFLMFRIFDVTKPGPIRKLEKLPAGWGILMDDLGAAVCANIICQLLIRLTPLFRS